MQFKTIDIAKLGISRVLNKKWEADGVVSGPSIKKAGGPWQAALYSLGDLCLRVALREITKEGFRLKRAGELLFGLEFFEEELACRKYIVITLTKTVAGVGSFHFCDKVSETGYKTELYWKEDLYILNWERVRKKLFSDLADRAIREKK